jgi:hypothetical protein
MAVSQPSDPGEGWARMCDLTQFAQLRRPTMEYQEKVRSQFLSLRHATALRRIRSFESTACEQRDEGCRGTVAPPRDSEALT